MAGTPRITNTVRVTLRVGHGEGRPDITIDRFRRNFGLFNFLSVYDYFLF